MGDTDADLLRAWRGLGDRAALDSLVARHLPRIHRLLARLTSPGATADDLTQEVFLRLAGKLDTFAADAEFTTWLHRIALNVAYSHWDQKQRRRTAPLSPACAPLAPDRHGPEASAATAERLATIDRALAELPPKRRVALVLVCLEGLTVEQAAALEGCPPQTIYSRLHEARRQLKTRLQDLLR